MTDFYRRLMYILAGMLCLLLIYAGMTHVGRRLSSGTTRPFLGGWAAIRNRFSILRENKEILERQAKDQAYSQLLLEHRTRSALETENRQLRAMLKLKASRGWTIVHSDVLLRDPITWNWSFQISKGSNDGIQLGNPVMFQDKLIGKVIEVYRESARVVTIGSPEFKCSVVVLAANGVEYPGILQGDDSANGTGPAVCKVDYLDKNAPVRRGHLVLSSGMGTDFPYGIPIGTIDREGGEAVETIEHARLRCQVKPAADFREIYAVTVVIHPKR